MIKRHFLFSKKLNDEKSNDEIIKENDDNEIRICELIIEGCKELNNHYGATMLSNFLKGNKPQVLLDAGLQNKKLYGCLNFIKTKTIYDIIMYLVDEGILYKSPGLYPSIRVNETVNFSIDNQFVKNLIHQQETIKSINNEEIQYNLAKYGDFNIFVDDEGVILTDTQLLDDLRTLRMQIASEKCIPPYCICHNKALVLLATIKPLTREEFLSIKGIQNSWYQKYAHLFVECIKKRK